MSEAHAITDQAASKSEKSYGFLAFASVFAVAVVSVAFYGISNVETARGYEIGKYYAQEYAENPSGFSVFSLPNQDLEKIDPGSVSGFAIQEGISLNNSSRMISCTTDDAGNVTTSTLLRGSVSTSKQGEAVVKALEELRFCETAASTTGL